MSHPRVLYLALILNVVLGMPAVADEARDESSWRDRFGVWAGAGTGVLVSDATYIPYRLNLGAEIHLGAERRLAVGYQFVAPLSSGSQPFRMIHYFPGIRYFVLPDSLSVRFSPGISMQGMGMMMGRWGQDQGVGTSVALVTSVEYRFEIEPGVFIGVEGAYDYLSRAADRSFPSVSIWTANVNFCYRFGPMGHGHMAREAQE